MSENLMMVERRAEGPVEILCKEIEMLFYRRLEKADLFLAFVQVLVSEVEQMRDIALVVSSMTGRLPSTESAIVLEKVKAMLSCPDLPVRHKLCAELHLFIDAIAPEEEVPCDHLIDMLRSCVSAVRFGLEIPCSSRHAAEAAYHVWRLKYGIALQDRHSYRWSKDWARAKFQEALVYLWLQGRKPGAAP